jgi:plastocyanin
MPSTCKRSWASDVRRIALAWAIVALPAFAAAETHVVTIEGMQNKPAELVVKPGDKVVWHNKDLVPHTATAKGRFDSGEIRPDQRWTWTAGKAGRYDYVCTFHPGMKAGIVVR